MYLLFSGESYYPSGGIDDFIGEFSCLEHAQAYLMWVTKPDNDIWAHIVDKKTMLKVSTFWQGDARYHPIWGSYYDRRERIEYKELCKKFEDQVDMAYGLTKGLTRKQVSNNVDYILSQANLKKAKQNGERVAT
jgi:hypothetical protein